MELSALQTLKRTQRSYPLRLLRMPSRGLPTSTTNRKSKDQEIGRIDLEKLLATRVNDEFQTVTYQNFDGYPICFLVHQHLLRTMKGCSSP